MKPHITCLIGSTRFRKEFEQAFREEEHAGRICLTVPCFKDDPCCKTKIEQEALDRLHRDKIDIATSILVINPGGYVGESTKAEIDYCHQQRKPIRWLEQPR